MRRQPAARGHLLPGPKPTGNNPLGHQLPDALLQGAVQIAMQEKRFGGDRHFGLIGAENWTYLAPLPPICQVS
jgi:hypothetical protein